MTTTTVSAEGDEGKVRDESTTTTEGDGGAATTLAGRWVQVRTIGDAPDPRVDACLVCDPDEERLLLFGGWDEDDDFNDLWAFDVSSRLWMELRPAGEEPSARSEAAMAYDPVGKKLYLFGGWDGEEELDLGDTWVYDPAEDTWTDLDPAGETPIPRNAHSLIYDPQGERLVLFGGSDQRGLEYNDVWVYDPAENVWTELDPAGDAPPRRGWHGAAYDSENRRMVIFGGGASEGAGGDLECLNDTWAYELQSGTWVELRPEGDLPAEIYGVAMAYDPVEKTIVFHGGGSEQGFFPETWVFDATSDQWTQVELTGRRPPSSLGHSSVYEPVSGRVLVFGGIEPGEELGLDEIWAFEPSDEPSVRVERAEPAPSPREAHAAAYDPLGEQMIVFGGWDDEEELDLGDTWAYQAEDNLWTKLDPSGDLPADRSGHAMVYDPVGEQVILFGGWSDTAYFNDTWSYDPAADRWTRVRTSGGLPSVREGHKMVYDPGTETVLMFGGHDGYEDQADTWSFDPRTEEWTEVPASGDWPEPRSYQIMFHDPVQDRVVMMGGSTWTEEDGWGAIDLDSPWVYDPATETWVELEDTGRAPTLRHTDGAAYDPVAEVLVVFGGVSEPMGFYGAESLDDTWGYDPAANRWSESLPDGRLPTGRGGHTLVYDSVQGKMILFGGYSYDGSYYGEEDLNDTWIYDLSTDTWTEVLPGTADLRQTSLVVSAKS